MQVPTSPRGCFLRLTPCASRLGGDLGAASSRYSIMILAFFGPRKPLFFNPPQAPSPALFCHGLNCEIFALPFLVRSAAGGKRPESFRRGKGLDGPCGPLSAI